MLHGGMTTQNPRPVEDHRPPAASLFGDVNLSSPQVRALRIAIIVMSILIVMGLVAVVGRIIYLITKPAAQVSASTGALVPEVTATLPSGAHVRNVTLQGDRLAIHYETAAGTGIAVIDLVSGRTLSRVHLAPDPPKP